MSDPDEFEEIYRPSDTYARVTDMPDGRTRVIETPDFAPGDIHESGEMRKPRILDRAQRRVLLDTRGRHSDFSTRWQDGCVTVASWGERVKLVIDVAGDRFRDDKADGSGWQPIGSLQAYVDGRIQSWADAFPPPTRLEIWRAWANEYGFGIVILIGLAVAAWAKWR